MVFELECNSCGFFRETKYCQILKMDVCYECCTLCKKRNECNLRVWFKNIIPYDKKGAKKTVTGSTLDSFLK
ncbi:hypothetical protein BFU36_04605 [Sulfolobus sp. A20]|nr:hypothetical protein BFU36_04605 [Sulfolobus sp. A20]TRM76143.1 hypothetical protein DJ532_08225 [Sulfolobus sp. A20-N-F8]TRM86414.1 hypothetical protein DJ529_11365 [Sulfolobus sp. C3]TRM99223.1 hypothetical protein DJ527_09025 [Sulfolobus sp. F1]